MSQGPAEENPRLDEEVREAERQLANLTTSPADDNALTDDALTDDALTDDDARAPDEAPSEENARRE
ncbi:hypothetical protein ACWDXH_03900 [Micromonospora chokoriensis]